MCKVDIKLSLSPPTKSLGTGLYSVHTRLCVNTEEKFQGELPSTYNYASSYNLNVNRCYSYLLVVQ